LEDCPKSIVRIPVRGREKSGKTPGWKQVYCTNELSKILEEFPAGEEEYPGKLQASYGKHIPG
jgi:hypothetical protein